MLSSSYDLTLGIDSHVLLNIASFGGNCTEQNYIVAHKEVILSIWLSQLIAKDNQMTY